MHVYVQNYRRSRCVCDVNVILIVLLSAQWALARELTEIKRHCEQNGGPGATSDKLNEQLSDWLDSTWVREYL